MVRRIKPKQLETRLPTWGGRRRGAGRKSSGPRRKVEHSRRPTLSGREPLHVTWRIAERVWSLRTRQAFRMILASFARSAKDQFRLTHFSVQSNHIHLIVGAGCTTAHSRGMQGLAVRLARGIHKLMGEGGKIFADRYHCTALSTPTQVGHAIDYVLNNHRKHAAEHGWPLPTGPDSFAAGPGIVEGGASEWARTLGAILDPRTWLLRVGWLQGVPVRAAA